MGHVLRCYPRDLVLWICIVSQCFYFQLWDLWDYSASDILGKNCGNAVKTNRGILRQSNNATGLYVFRYKNWAPYRI